MLLRFLAGIVGLALASPASADVDSVARWMADKAQSLATQGAINVQNYAIGSWASVASGASDLKPSWDAAVAAATAAGVKSIYLPGGNYLTTGPLNNPGLALSCEPGKTTIRKSGPNQLFTSVAANPDIPNGKLLAADVSYGAMSVTLATGGGAAFAVGQTVVLLDSSAYNAGHPAEYATIQAISGDVVTFWSPVQLSYSTASAAKLVPVNLLKGVAYKDCNIVMDDTITLFSSLVYQPNFAIEMRFLDSPVIKNVTISKFVGPGVNLVGVKGAKIDIFAYDGGSSTSSGSSPDSTQGVGGFSYAVNEQALNEGNQINVYAERIRHAYTTVDGLDPTVWNYGEASGTIVTGVHKDAKNMAWDCHQAGRGIHFDVTALGGQYAGLQVRCKKTEAKVRAIGTLGPAVWLRGGGGLATNGDNSKVEFYAERTNTGVTFDGLDWREKGAVTDDGVGNDIAGYAYQTGGPILYTGFTPANVTTGGNYHDLFGKEICQLATANTHGVHIGTAANGAQIKIDGLYVYSPDAKVTALVFDAPGSVNILASNITGVGYTGFPYYTPLNSTIMWRNSDGPFYLAQPEVRFLDEFSTTTANTSYPNWNRFKGSNATAALPAVLSDTVNGYMRLVTGVDAGGTMALNGSSMATQLIWQASKGNLSAEFRIQTGSSVANQSIFVGLTSNNFALNAPFTLAAGDTLTANVTDGVGFLYDTNATTQHFWQVGVANSVLAAKQDTGITPTTFTRYTLRVDIDASGVAKFYNSNILLGTAMVGAVTPAAQLALVVATYSTTGSSTLLQVDRIAAQQNR